MRKHSDIYQRNESGQWEFVNRTAPLDNAVLPRDHPWGWFISIGHRRGCKEKSPTEIHKKLEVLLREGEELL